MNAEKKLRNKIARKENKILLKIRRNMPVVNNPPLIYETGVYIQVGMWRNDSHIFKQVLTILENTCKTFHKDAFMPFFIVEDAKHGKTRIKAFPNDPLP